MTKTTKILLGVGALALAYYFYTKRGKGSVASNEAPSEPNSGGSKPPTRQNSDTTCPEGQVLIQPNCIKAPCNPICGEKPKNGLGGVVPPNTYRLKEDFSQRFPIGLSGSGSKTFKKGDVIRATTNPYAKNSNLYTTIEGNQPDFQKSGEIWIAIPSNILEKL